MKLLLDPGHGGLQLGHVHADVEEKALTLALATDVALRLGDTHRVFLTRARDEDVSHRERQKMAGSADLTVSLHFHGVGNPFVHRVEGGARVADGEALARLLLEKVSLAVGETYVYRPTQARITTGTKKPVCVLRLGYLSNPETLAALVSGDRMQVTAQALVEGLLAHAGR